MFLRKCFDCLPHRSGGSSVFGSILFVVGAVTLMCVGSAAAENSATGDSPEAQSTAAEAPAPQEPSAVVEPQNGTVDSPSEDAGVESGAGADSENADAETEAVEVVVEESPFSSPEKALVALRGDVRVGLGILSTFEGRTVVVTSVSAFEGNRRLIVNTAEGVEVPIVGVVAVWGKDLAFLAVDDSELELPIAELGFDVEMDPKQGVTVLNPHREIPLKVGANKGGRLEIAKLEGPIFAGSPAVIGKQVVGVFSPARIIGDDSSSNGKSTSIWSAGIVPLDVTNQWEVIDLSTMAMERTTLEECQVVISEMGKFFGVNGRGEDVTMQRLVAARERLKDGLSRSGQTVEKDSARRSFVFSMRSAAGSVLEGLEEAQNEFYSYFRPEVAVLMDLYRPVYEKIEALKKNPKGADSFAR
ncbi:MAG: hypothetical protein ACQKBT_09070 [Puniceicoccales bacterium]